MLKCLTKQSFKDLLIYFDFTEFEAPIDPEVNKSVHIRALMN